jgi:NAD(P)-dependent dehydrogenase (short-subunit alcohol dehydrogenase family)
MLLEDKNAVIYGGGGSIGGAVARAFAREGAKVFLASRTLESLEGLTEQIRSAGGAAEAARVDALDEGAIDEHADTVAASAGSIDVSFNAISIRDVQLIPLAEMTREDFMSPIATGMSTHFLTARAAARHMIGRGSGVILTLSSSSVRAFVPGVHVGGFGVAGAAIEAFTKMLAAELGPRGIRAVCLRPEGIPESWGRLDRGLVRPASRDRGTDQGPFPAGASDDAGRRGQRGVLGFGSGRCDDRNRLRPDQRHGRRLGEAANSLANMFVCATITLPSHDRPETRSRSTVGFGSRSPKMHHKKRHDHEQPPATGPGSHRSTGRI